MLETPNALSTINSNIFLNLIILSNCVCDNLKDITMDNQQETNGS